MVWLEAMARFAASSARSAAPSARSAAAIAVFELASRSIPLQVLRSRPRRSVHVSFVRSLAAVSKFSELSYRSFTAVLGTGLPVAKVVMLSPNKKGPSEEGPELNFNPLAWRELVVRRIDAHVVVRRLHRGCFQPVGLDVGDQRREAPALHRAEIHVRRLTLQRHHRPGLRDVC